MNGFVLISLCFVATVSAQEELSWISSSCPYGAVYDQSGYLEFCNRQQGEFCAIASGSYCKTLWGSDGICCNRAPVDPAPLQCPDGSQPYPTARCVLGGSCPDPRRYECVANPLIRSSQGICCPRSGSGQGY